MFTNVNNAPSNVGKIVRIDQVYFNQNFDLKLNPEQSQNFNDSDNNIANDISSKSHDFSANVECIKNELLIESDKQLYQEIKIESVRSGVNVEMKKEGISHDFETLDPGLDKISYDSIQFGNVSTSTQYTPTSTKCQEKPFFNDLCINGSEIVLRMSTDSEKSDDTFVNIETDENEENQLVDSALVLDGSARTRSIDDYKKIARKIYATRSRSTSQSSEMKDCSVRLENLPDVDQNENDDLKDLEKSLDKKIIDNAEPKIWGQFSDFIVKVCCACNALPISKVRRLTKCRRCFKYLKYKCLLCNNLYLKTYNGIYLHIKKFHMTDSGLMFSDDSEIKKYSILNCNKCNDTFPLVDANNFTCPRCDIKMELRCIACSSVHQKITEMHTHIAQSHNFKMGESPVKQTEFLSSVKEIHSQHEISPVLDRNGCTKCVFCEKKFNNATSLKKHLNYCKDKIAQENLYQCEYCTFTTDVELNMNIHIIQIHLAQLNRTIEKIASTSNLLNISKMIKTADPDNNNKNDSKLSRKNVKDTDKKSLGVKKFFQNSKESNKNDDLKKNFRPKNLKDFLPMSKNSVIKNEKIPKDGFKNKLSKDDVAKLMMAHCPKCNKPRPVILYKSKCEKCETQLIFDCLKCDLEFKTREELRLHINHIHSNYSFKCLRCDRNFSVENNLKMHDKVCFVKKI